MANGSNAGFKRVLNTGDVIMVAFGAMIGWGWVVSSGQWIQTGGAIGTAIAFCIGGIMIYHDLSGRIDICRTDYRHA